MASEFDNIFGTKPKSDFDSVFDGGTAIVEPPTTGIPGVTAELPTISLEQAQRKDQELLRTTGDLLTQLGLETTDVTRQKQQEAERLQVATAGRSAFEEAKTSLKRGGLNVVAGLGGTLEELARLADKPILNQLGEVGAEFAHSARVDLRDPKLTPSSFEGKTHAQKTGLFITQVVPETLSFMVGTTVATILGGPVAGGTFAFSVEGENAFQDALNKGDTPEQANIDRMVVGTINAALEQMQVNNVLKFGKNGFNTLAKLARERTFAALKTFGKEVSLTALKQFITEGLQEATQEAVALGTPAIRRGEDVDFVEASKQIGLAGLAGGVAGVVLGGAATGVDILSAALSQKTTADASPPTTVAEIFATKPPVQDVAPETPVKPAVVTPQVTKAVEAKPEAVQEKLPEGIKISDTDIFDSRGGESFGRINATDKDGKVIGTVEFSDFEDEIAIKFIDVLPEHQRKGIATALRAKLKQEFPDSEITRFGDFTTEEGAKFKESLKPEAVEGEVAKPTTVAEIFAEPTITDRPTGPKQPEITDQTLLSERSDIKKIPQKERSVEQIARINEIEDELVLRHADEFEDIDISPKTRKIETKKVQDEILANGIYQSELDAIGDIPNLSGSFNVDSQEIGDVKARFEGRKDILKKFTLQETGGLRWDSAAAELEAGIETLDEFMDMVELFVDSNKAGRGAVHEGALANALNTAQGSEEAFLIEMLIAKHEMFKNGFTAAEINKEIAELASREGIKLENIEQDLISLKEITDVEKKQTILRELDKEVRKAKVKKVTDPERIAIERAGKIAAKTKKPVFIREKAGKFTVLKAEPKQGEFIKITPAPPGEIESGFERITAESKKPKPTPKQTKETKLLIQRINIAKKIKGLTNKRFEELKKKHGGARRLTGRKPRSVEQLKAVLKAIEKARPRKIANKTVVSPKTEKQIAELRKNLTDLEFMNDGEFQKILDIEVRGKEAKFISAKSFITQSEANKVLARMHDTAQRLRVTEPIRRAVEKSPEISAEIKKTDKLPSKAKDPSRLKSMRFFFQRMGEQASQPIYEVFLDLTLEEQQRSRFRHKAMKRAESLPDFAKIANDKEALQRVEDWITSQSRLAGKPKFPKDITKNEKRLARLIQANFESYETLARAGKMFEFSDNRAEMPQYLKFKQGIDKAFDIFNTKGYDALITYLDTQDWGIVSAGYSPMESVVKKVSTNRMPDIAVGKGRIRQRGIQYRKQDRDILQRWYSYMRQMDQLIHIQPRIKSLVRLVNDNQDSFIKPSKINSAVSTYLDNLKHTNYEDGLIEEWSKRLYSQAITVRVLADPLKPFRNLAQNLAFSEDRRDFMKIAGKKALGKTILSAEDTEYLETHVQQSSVMMSDWAFVGEDPLLFKNLTKWIQRKTLYPASDRINRLMSFSAKIDRARTAFNKKQSLAKKMTQARFSDMQKTEQRVALEVLAKDGVDAMARFVAKVHTDNTHFLYAREQRSPAEQTKLGRIALNLALFRRAALEKAVFQLEKVFQRGTGFGKKRRAASVLVSLLGFSYLTGVLWKRLTGQKYSPYSYFSFLEMNFGGLEVATIEKAEAVYNDMLDIIISQDRGKALDKFGTDITRVADYMIPFYDLGLRAIEATLGTENIDRVPFKKMREIIDSEFESRGLREVNRSLVQKIQFTFAASRQTEQDKDNFTFTGKKE